MFSLVPLVIFTGTFFVASWFVDFWKRPRRKHRLPPSLPSLPFVGSLPFMTELDALPKYFTKLAYKLGPVFTLRIGSRFVVVLNNKECIENALVRHSSSFSDREFYYTEKYCINLNQKGIAFKHFDEEFKRYHKLVLTCLKEFGFGSRSQLETRILVEVDELIKYCRSTSGKAFDPKELLIMSASNVPLNIMFGRRNDYKNGMTEAVFQMKRFVDSMDPAVNLFPMLRFIPPHSKRFSITADSIRRVLKALEKDVDESMKDEGTDSFVRRYIEKEGPNYDREQLLFTLRDFLGGSTDTTATTLLWYCVYIANNPRVADRLQKEIDSIVPRDRLPTIDDQSKLTYVEATILELLRHRAPLPLAIPHLTLHDTEVLGYFIPADTVVLPNIKAAHMNKIDWLDPDDFRPERFLDENKQIINRNRMLAFSVGRRSCPGEGLAREQLFLFISGLMQNFHLRPPENMDSISVKTVYSITEGPSPYTIRMIARNDEKNILYQLFNTNVDI